MRVREVRSDELNEVFMMGYDAWGASLPPEMYIDSCAASYKYKQGQFYVLESTTGELLSSAIVYPLAAFGGVVSERAVGLGSLATAQSVRHRGYATLFLSLLMAKLESDGVDAFFIHSDIHPKIYQKLGFYAAPDRFKDRSMMTTPMLRFSGDRAITPELWGEFILPKYF